MDELSQTSRPYKRPRLHYESSNLELERKRARHDLHLKARFERIFQKYEKDFSETADEIDLETGEIVVNSGHLAAMTDEFDLGQNPESTSHQQPDVWNIADDLDSQDTDSTNNEEEDIAPFSVFNGATQAMPAWQGSPLPEDLSKSFGHPESPSTSADKSEVGRSPSPPMGSLWAPMAGRGRPRRDGPATQRRRPPRRRERHENDMSYVPSKFRPKPWSQEENELLLKLKTTTPLTYREMEPKFPGRKRGSIAFHWSHALRCGERHPHLDDDDNNVVPTASTVSEEEIILHDHSPSEETRNCESSSRARGIPGHSTLLLKLPTNPDSRRLLSPSVKSASSEQELDATLDFDNELDDYPPAKELSAVHLTKSSPVPARSRNNSVVSATKALKSRGVGIPEITHPETKKHQPLNITHSHATSLVHACSRTSLVVSTTITMKPQEAVTSKTNDPQAKKYRPLNKTPPHERASAPSYRTRTGFSVVIPLLFKKYKQPDLLGKATTTPRPLVVDDFSEDELATSVKTIEIPQAPTKKSCGSNRRSTSY